MTLKPGLTIDLLAYLSRYPNSSSGEIARALDESQSTIHSRLRYLEKIGMVTCQTKPHVQRSGMKTVLSWTLSRPGDDAKAKG